MNETKDTLARRFYDANLRRRQVPTYWHGELRRIDGGQCLFLTPNHSTNREFVEKLLRGLTGKVLDGVEMVLVGSDGTREVITSHVVAGTV